MVQTIVPIVQSKMNNELLRFASTMRVSGSISTNSSVLEVMYDLSENVFGVSCGGYRSLITFIYGIASLTPTLSLTRSYILFKTELLVLIQCSCGFPATPFELLPELFAPRFGTHTPHVKQNWLVALTLVKQNVLRV